LRRFVALLRSFVLLLRRFVYLMKGLDRFLRRTWGEREPIVASLATTVNGFVSPVCGRGLLPCVQIEGLSLVGLGSGAGSEGAFGSG
jgi:hypothetical protein